MTRKRRTKTQELQGEIDLLRERVGELEDENFYLKEENRLYLREHLDVIRMLVSEIQKVRKLCPSPATDRSQVSYLYKELARAFTMITEEEFLAQTDEQLNSAEGDDSWADPKIPKLQQPREPEIEEEP